MAELAALRTYTSKTQSNQDGSLTLEAHAGHIHFLDNGVLEDVDLRFVDRGTYWEMTKASYKLRVVKDFGAPVLLQFDNRYLSAVHTITYEPHSLWWVNADDRSQRQLARSAQPVTGTLIDDRTIRWIGAFGPGVHYQVSLQRSGFRKEVVFTAEPTSPPFANYEVGFLARWGGDGLGVYGESNTQWDGSSFFLVQDQRIEVRETGGPRSYILPAYARDSADRVRSIPVFYEQRDGDLWQGKLIPRVFFENAAYPMAADATTNFYTGAGDGYASRDANADWATAQNTADGNNAYYTQEWAATIQSRITAGAYTIYRCFMPVDTSALPDDCTISAATFYFWPNTVYDDDNDAQAYMAVVQTNQASTSSLVVGDYDECGDSVDDPTTGGTKDLSLFSAGSYQTIDLDATGIGWISKTGITKLGFREGHDAEDDSIVGSPDARSGIYWRSSEYTGTANDPYLAVTYTTIVTPAVATAVAAKVDPTVALGSVSVTPAVTTAVAVSVAPTVVEGSLAITPSAITAVAVSVAPTVIKGSISITPSAASSIAGSVAPTVVLGSISATPSAASAIGSTLDPLVIQGSLALAPAVASAIGGRVDPTVVLGSLGLTPTAASAIASGVDPTVLGEGTVVTPVAASAIAAIASPTVVLGSVTVGPAAAGAVASKVDPTVVHGSLSLAPTAASAIGGTASPAVILGSVAITPTPSSAIAAIAAPVVAIGGDLVLTPSPASTVAGISGPVTIQGSLVLTPTAVAVIAVTQLGNLIAARMIALSLNPRSLSLTLQPRSLDCTLDERSLDLTLQPRDLDLTLKERSLGLTLQEAR